MALSTQIDQDGNLIERDEIHQLYLQRDTLHDCTDFRSWPLDAIDPGLVGGIKVRAVLRTHGFKELQKTEVDPCGSFLQLLLYLVCVRVPERVAEERIPSVTVAPWFAAKIHEAVSCKLVTLFKQAHVCLCGFFGVPKAAQQALRVIFDARPANVRLAPLRWELRLFTLAELATAINTIKRRHGRIFTLSVDYRHYYYQIALPEWLRRYFVINCATGRFAPTVMSMGYRDACAIAQALTWAILLSRQPNESGIGVTCVLGNMTNMPPFVEVKLCGVTMGYLFVLLDGIFGVFASKKLAERWNERLVRNENRFHVIRKNPEVPAVSEPTDSTPTEFAGLLISQGRVKPSKAIGTLQQNPTNRQVASFCGRMLWSLRVSGLRACGVVHSTPSPLLSEGLLLSCWSATIRDANERSWDALSGLSPDVFAQLQRQAEVYEPAAEPSWTELKGCPPCRTCIRRAKLGASDAMPTRLGWLIFEGERVIEAAEEIERVSQVVAEGQALVRLARAVARLPTATPCPVCGGPQLLIAAIDADAVRYAVRKGYSSSPDLRDILRAIFGGSVALYVVRVAGKENAADAPSRGRAPEEEALRETRASCARGLEEISGLAIEWS